VAVWTCAVTTRALRGKQFFRGRPLVLAFHTYLTRLFATRKFYPCGTNFRWRTGVVSVAAPSWCVFLPSWIPLLDFAVLVVFALSW